VVSDSDAGITSDDGTASVAAVADAEVILAEDARLVAGSAVGLVAMVRGVNTTAISDVDPDGPTGRAEAETNNAQFTAARVVTAGRSVIETNELRVEAATPSINFPSKSNVYVSSIWPGNRIETDDREGFAFNFIDFNSRVTLKRRAAELIIDGDGNVVSAFGIDYTLLPFQILVNRLTGADDPANVSFVLEDPVVFGQDSRGNTIDDNPRRGYAHAFELRGNPTFEAIANLDRVTIRDASATRLEIGDLRIPQGAPAVTIQRNQRFRSPNAGTILSPITPGHDLLNLQPVRENRR